MKNKKAYDNLVCSVLGIIGVVTVLLCVNACDRGLENATPKENTKAINHATEVYEIEFEGAKYIVVQTHRGVGVCVKKETADDTTSCRPLPEEDVLLGFVPGAPQHLIPGDLPSNNQHFYDPPKIGPDGLPLDN